MSEERDLRRLEDLLVRISDSHRRWWIGGLLLAALGSLALASGWADFMATGQKNAPLVTGGFLIAMAIIYSVDGYHWARVGEYIRLRGRIRETAAPAAGGSD